MIFAPYKITILAEGPEGEYLTDRLGGEAVRFIEQQKDKPFFLYLPHFAVHMPIQGKEALVKKYRAKKRPGQGQTNEIYAAMIESMDDTVGRIRRKLDELKLSGRTVVVFASDNGGRVPTTSNLPLRVDLAAELPEKVDRLRTRLHAWRQEVGAQMPARNPHYDPSRPEYDPKKKKEKPAA